MAKSSKGPTLSTVAKKTKAAAAEKPKERTAKTQPKHAKAAKAPATHAKAAKPPATDAKTAKVLDTSLRRALQVEPIADDHEDEDDDDDDEDEVDDAERMRVKRETKLEEDKKRFKAWTVPRIPGGPRTSKTGEPGPHYQEHMNSCIELVRKLVESEDTHTIIPPRPKFHLNQLAMKRFIDYMKRNHSDILLSKRLRVDPNMKGQFGWKKSRAKKVYMMILSKSNDVRLEVENKCKLLIRDSAEVKLDDEDRMEVDSEIITLLHASRAHVAFTPEEDRAIMEGVAKFPSKVSDKGKKEGRPERMRWTKILTSRQFRDMFKKNNRTAGSLRKRYSMMTGGKIGGRA